MGQRKFGQSAAWTLGAHCGPTHCVGGTSDDISISAVCYQVRPERSMDVGSPLRTNILCGRRARRNVSIWVPCHQVGPLAQHRHWGPSRTNCTVWAAHHMHHAATCSLGGVPIKSVRAGDELPCARKNSQASAGEGRLSRRSEKDAFSTAWGMRMASLLHGRLWRHPSSHDMIHLWVGASRGCECDCFAFLRVSLLKVDVSCDLLRLGGG